MKNTKKVNAILTGIFIIAGIAILFAGVFIIGNKNRSFTKTILVKAIFDDVNGLAKGNNVWYSGVTIGVVKKILFIDNGVEVSFSIEEQAKKKIRTDTKVKLGSDGLIGNKIIVLYGGTSASPEITAGAALIVVNGIGPEAMLTTLQENNKNLLEITSNFKAVSKGLADGEGTIGKLLGDETLFNGLQATMFRLNNAGVNAEIITSNLAEFTRKINSKGSLTNDLITDTIIVRSLKSTVQDLRQVILSANNIVQNLNTATEKLDASEGTIGVLLNNDEAASNMKNTLVNLESGTKKLDENMEALQHNFLLRGFFRKRARAKETSRKDSIRMVLSQN